MSRTLPERRGALAALDFFLVIGCYLGATYFLLGDRATMYLLYENGMSAHVFSAGALLFLFYVQGIYDTRNRRADMELLSRLITAVGSVFVLQAGMFYIQRSLAMPLSMMLTGSGAAVTVLFVTKLVYYRIRSGSFGSEGLLLVGATPLHRQIAAKIQTSPESGFVVVGFLDDTLEPGTVVAGAQVLGPLSALWQVRQGLAPHRVFADLSPEELRRIPVDRTGGSGVLEKPDGLYELLFARLSRVQVTDVLFHGVLVPPRFRMSLLAILSDLVALAGLLVLAPAIIVIAILIRVTSGGPVLERQLTAGWKLRPFTRLRFRCDHVVERDGGMARETTNLGAWLIRLHLRGIPQLWNLLRGEMALVGTPLLRTEFADALIEALPHYRLMYAMKPGLASWSLVNGAADAAAALQYDLYYLRSMSLSYTLTTLLRAIAIARSRRESDTREKALHS